MKKLFAAAALSAFATLAYAQMAPQWSELDKDSSGTLSPEEIKAGMPTMTDAEMMKFDVNSDKMIDQDEYTKMVQMIGK